MNIKIYEINLLNFNKTHHVTQKCSNDFIYSDRKMKRQKWRHSSLMLLSKNLFYNQIQQITLTPARPAPLIFTDTFIKRALRLSGHTPAVIRFHGENGEKGTVCARVCQREREGEKESERVGERELYIYRRTSQQQIAPHNCARTDPVWTRRNKQLKTKQ